MHNQSKQWFQHWSNSNRLSFPVGYLSAPAYGPCCWARSLLQWPQAHTWMRTPLPESMGPRALPPDLLPPRLSAISRRNCSAVSWSSVMPCRSSKDRLSVLKLWRYHSMTCLHTWRRWV